MTGGRRVPRRSCAKHMEGDRPILRFGPVFEQINRLPRSQRRDTVPHGNRGAGLGRRRLDVGRHAVRTFGVVPEWLPSGTTRWKKSSKSALTSGPAFSCTISEADVCRHQTVSSPVPIPCASTRARTGRVMSWSAWFIPTVWGFLRAISTAFGLDRPGVQQIRGPRFGLSS